MNNTDLAVALHATWPVWTFISILFAALVIEHFVNHNWHVMRITGNLPRAVRMSAVVLIPVTFAAAYLITTLIIS